MFFKIKIVIGLTEESMQDGRELIKKLSKSFGKEALVLRKIDDWRYVGVKDNSYAVIMKNQLIKDLTEKLPEKDFLDYTNYLILPGFVDIHTHLSQINITGKGEEDLIIWLNKIVYPEEGKFEDDFFIGYSLENSSYVKLEKREILILR